MLYGLTYTSFPRESLKLKVALRPCLTIVGKSPPPPYGPVSMQRGGEERGGEGLFVAGEMDQGVRGTVTDPKERFRIPS